MANVMNNRADMYCVMGTMAYAIVFPMLSKGDAIGHGSGNSINMDLILSGIMAVFVSYFIYYIHELIYSRLLYRMQIELVMYGVGLSVMIGYLSYLTLVVYPNTPFDRLLIDLRQLNEGLANITWIVFMLIFMTLVSVIFGNTLGETLYRLAFMYVVPLGNLLVIYYYNPMDFSYPILVHTMNVILIYLTIRQFPRCKGLDALMEHHY